MHPANRVDISGKVLGSRPRNNVKTSKRNLVCNAHEDIPDPITNLAQVKRSIKNQGKLDMLKNLLANGAKKVTQNGDIVDKRAKVKEYSRAKSGSKHVSVFSVDHSGSKEPSKSGQLFLNRSKDKTTKQELLELKQTEPAYLRSRNISNINNKAADASQSERKSGNRPSGARGTSFSEKHTDNNSTKASDTITGSDSKTSDARALTRSGRHAPHTNATPNSFETPADRGTGISRTRSKSIKQTDAEVPSKILQQKNPFSVSRPSAAATPESPPQKKKYLQQQLENLTLGKRTPDLEQLPMSFKNSHKKAGVYRPNVSTILDEDVFLSDAHHSPRKDRPRSQDSWRDKSFEKGGSGALPPPRLVPKSTQIKQQHLTVGELPPGVRPLSECLQEMLPSQKYVETVQDIAKGKIPSTERFVDLDTKEESDTVAEVLTLISANLQTLNRLTDNVKTMNENKALDAVLAQALIETANRSQLRRVLDWIQQTAGIQSRGKKLVKEHVLQEAEKRLGLRLKRSKTVAQLEEQKQAASQNNKTKEPARQNSKMVPEQEEEEEELEPPGTLLAILGGVGELAPSAGRSVKRYNKPAEVDQTPQDIIQEAPEPQGQPVDAVPLVQPTAVPMAEQPQLAAALEPEDDGGISLQDLWQATK